MQDKSRRRLSPRLQVALAIVVIVGLIVVARRDPTQNRPPVPAAERSAPTDNSRTAPPKTTAPEERPDAAPRSTAGDAAETTALIENVTLRNRDGRVVYRGDVDLSPTLARIRAGRKLREFRNDGSTFQNRERRLPRKPAGYYREYVHPTGDLPGPGPQRIVAGQSGELYYTPDHYETFQRLDGQAAAR